MANLNAVLSRPKIGSSYSRNAFDRSCSVNYHYQLGALTPFFAEPFVAGSHVKLNRGIFQRTAAVNTAAFPIVSTHCEFFYVPLRLLWSYWNNYKLNIQDFNSSYQGSLGSSGTFVAQTANIPTFNLSEVQNMINGFIADSNYSDTSLFTSKQLAVEASRLLDMLGYGGQIYGTGKPKEP